MSVDQHEDRRERVVTPVDLGHAARDRAFLGLLPRALSWPGAGACEAADDFEPNHERTAVPLSFLPDPQGIPRVPFEECVPHFFGWPPRSATEGALPAGSVTQASGSRRRIIPSARPLGRASRTFQEPPRRRPWNGTRTGSGL